MVGEGCSRILLLTADLGQGHNTAARAIAERVDQLWPGIRDFRSTVAELVADQGRLAKLRAAELAHLQGRDLCDDLALLGDRLGLCSVPTTEPLLALTFDEPAADR